MPKTPKAKQKRPKSNKDERKKKAKRLKFDEEGQQNVDKIDSEREEFDEKKESEDEDGGKDLEKILEEHADKNNLSAINVKSILHHVITDKRVLELVQKVIAEKQQEGDDTNAEFEPKMTRSKYKQKNLGDPITQLTKSPLKSKKPVSTFTELEFPESSSDEEYSPDEDEEDEDTESCLSAQSDLASPFKPVSPISGTQSEQITNTTATSSLIPGGRPLTRHRSQEMLFKKPEISLQQQDAANEQSDDDLIAKRTRSHLPLHDTILPLHDIELPDFTPDLYDQIKLDDLDDDQIAFQKFLQSLANGDDNDILTEDDDCEYDFMAENIDNVEEKEEFRNDRAVRIPKKEVSDLFAELLNECNGEDDDNLWSTRSLLLELEGGDPSEDVALFTVEQRTRLSKQMKQHLQLLTQVYLLSREEPSLQSEAEMCRQFVKEVQGFCDRSLSAHPIMALGGSMPATSMFDVPEIETAARIVNEPFTNVKRPRSPRKQPPMKDQNNGKDTKNKSHRLVLSPVSSLNQSIMANSPLFKEPILLPRHGFMDKEFFGIKESSSLRVKFTETEDNLLAIGMNQFERNWKLIQAHLLPIKTPKQLQIRCKNLLSSRAADNIVKHLRDTKKLLSLPTGIKISSEGDSTRRYSKHIEPDWLITYRQRIKPQRKQLPPSPSPRKASSLDNNKRNQFSPKLTPSTLSSAKPTLAASNPISAKLIPATPSSSSIKLSPSDSCSDILTPMLSNSVPLNSLTPNSISAEPVSSTKLIEPTLSFAESAKSNLIFAESSSSNSISAKPTTTNSVLQKQAPSSGGILSTPAHVALPVDEAIPFNNQVSDGAAILRQGSETTESIDTRVPKTGTFVDPMKEEAKPASYQPVQEKKNTLAATSTRDNTFEESEEHISKDNEDIVQSSQSIAINPTEIPINSPEIKPEVVDQAATDDNRNSPNLDIEVDDEVAPCTPSSCNDRDEVTQLEYNSPVSSENAVEKTSKLSPVNSSGKPKPGRDKLFGVPLVSQNTTKKINYQTLPALPPDPKEQTRAHSLANNYLDKVKKTLQDDQELYEEFLGTLVASSSNNWSPVQLYKQMKFVLADYPPLVEDFVAFLEPEQALQAGVLMENLEFIRARTFLRRLEVHFTKNRSHFQKIIKVFSTWSSGEKTPSELCDMIIPLLRGQQHLIDEFHSFFDNLKPPPCSDEDFEEIEILSGSDVEVDDFEEVVIPDIIEPHRKPKGKIKLKQTPGLATKTSTNKQKITPKNINKTKPIKADKRRMLGPKKSPLSAGSASRDGFSEDDSNDKKSQEDTNKLQTSERLAVDELEQNPSSVKTEWSTSDGPFSVSPPVHNDTSNDSVRQEDQYFDDKSSQGHVNDDLNDDIDVNYDDDDDENTAYDEDDDSDNSDDIDYDGDDTEDGHEFQQGTLSAQNHHLDGHGQLVVLWTREDDRTILSVCHSQGPSQTTFEELSKKLQNKTPNEIKKRFEELMKLYEAENGPYASSSEEDVSSDSEAE